MFSDIFRLLFMPAIILPALFYFSVNVSKYSFAIDFWYPLDSVTDFYIIYSQITRTFLCFCWFVFSYTCAADQAVLQ